MTKTGLIIGFIVWTLGCMVVGYALHRQFDPFKDHVKGVVVYNGTNEVYRVNGEVVGVDEVRRVR